MQACCDVAFKYAHEREAFKQKIGTFQVCFYFIPVIWMMMMMMMMMMTTTTMMTISIWENSK